MANIFLMEAANLFLGDADPSASKHLSLDSLALPELEYVTVDHHGGGAAGEISLSMNTLRKIEPTFKLAGFDIDSYRMFAIGAGKPDRYTAYGVLRSKQDGKALQAKAVISGVLGRVAPDAFERGQKLGHDHRIVEVTHYELIVGGEEWFMYDYFTTTRRRLGVDELAEVRTMLGLQ
jgi:P2 family phage contractile tail tube protein